MPARKEKKKKRQREGALHPTHAHSLRTSRLLQFAVQRQNKTWTSVSGAHTTSRTHSRTPWLSCHSKPIQVGPQHLWPRAQRHTLWPPFDRSQHPFSGNEHAVEIVDATQPFLSCVRSYTTFIFFVWKASEASSQLFVCACIFFFVQHEQTCV